MFFWNKVEIYSGNSLNEFSELRHSLAAAHIRYDYKIIDGNNPHDRNISRAGGYGSLGKKPDFVTRYLLYVHQKDYDQAMHLTSNRSVINS